MDTADILDGLARPRACMSIGPQQQHGTFYEFRTYSIQPEKNVALGCPMRRSTCILLTQSYWSMEYGGTLLKHLWHYAQQAGVRASLAQDPNWIAEYISKAMPMLTSQDNEVTYLVPWSKVESLPKDVNALWWYESPDHRASVRHKARGDARLVAAGKPLNLFPF
uniref:Nipsnap homolog 3A (C. elegans) n=1 Tax=Oncorhynchus mykiss TaxID=8022 RepID=A0A8C7RIL1_ONCMY